MYLVICGFESMKISIMWLPAPHLSTLERAKNASHDHDVEIHFIISIGTSIKGARDFYLMLFPLCQTYYIFKMAEATNSTFSLITLRPFQKIATRELLSRLKKNN